MSRVLSPIKNFDDVLLSLLCLLHLVLDLPEIKCGSPNGVSDGPDLSKIIKPVESDLLCNNSESCSFTEATSITECLEVLESFAGTALEPGYDSCSYSDLSVKDKIPKELVTSYKKTRPASAINQKCLYFCNDAMCIKSWVPAQLPRINLGKVRSSSSLAKILKKLRSNRSRCGSGLAK